MEVALKFGWREERDEWIESMAEKYGFEADSPTGDDAFVPPKEQADGSFEQVPLPWFIKRRFMKAFTRDVHHYLFNIQHSPRPGVTYDVQDEIQDTLRRRKWDTRLQHMIELEREKATIRILD